MKDLKTRNEIDDIYKWRLEDMFETAEEWQKDCLPSSKAQYPRGQKSPGTGKAPPKIASCRTG